MKTQGQYPPAGKKRGWSHYNIAIQHVRMALTHQIVIQASSDNFIEYNVKS